MGMTTAKPKLRWFQFSLRTLLVIVTLCAVLCSWLAVRMQQAKRERKAAAAIEDACGQVGWSEPSGPAWLRTLLGDDLFHHVDSVELDIMPAPPDDVSKPNEFDARFETS